MSKTSGGREMFKIMLRWALDVVLCVGVRVAYGQSAVDGAIGGTVQDSSGLPIPNAKVVIRSNTTNAQQKIVSDDAGFFRALHLQPSTYTVSITAAGFESFKSPEVIVQVGLLTDISPRLPVGSESDR